MAITTNIETQRAAFTWHARRIGLDVTPHPRFVNTFADDKTQIAWNEWPGRTKLLEENDGH